MSLTKWRSLRNSYRCHTHLIMIAKLVFAVVFLSISTVHSTPNETQSHDNNNNRANMHFIQKRLTDDGYSIVPKEFYKNTNYYQMLSYIFSQIKFTNKQCEVTFQNCLLDLNNQRSVKGYEIISEVCFPLQKSRFCLEEHNFQRSECAYFTILHRAQKHFARLSLNLETCLRRYPIQLSSTQLGSNSSSSINRSKSLTEFFILINIMLVCIDYYVLLVL